jgi:uncharacterized protein involved in outer membrane biogenesis
MKWLKIVLGVLLVILIVIIAAVSMFLNQIIKTGVEKGGPAVLGVPVTLEKADFSLLRGKAVLEELVIGNPEGFKTPFLFSMGELLVQINRGSLAKDTIIIEKIYIASPEISYEKSLKTSNIGALLKQLEGEEKPEEEKAEETPEPEAEKGAEKKVVIEDFLLEGGRIKLSVTLTGGRSLVVPLPPVHLTDIGKESGGASVTEVTTEIFGAIAGSVTKAVSASVEFVGDGVKVVGDGVMEVGDAAGDAAKKGAELAGDAAKKTGDAAKKTVGAAGDVAGKGVDAAGDAAKKTGAAVGKGVEKTGDAAKKALGGVKGLFGRDKE